MKYFIMVCVIIVATMGCSKSSGTGPEDGRSWTLMSALQTATGYDPAVAVYGGVVYVAYSDSANSAKLTVQKYENGAWSVVGTRGFSSNSASNVQICVINGIPYVGYSSGSLGATVYKYESSAWSLVGADGFTPGRADNFTMVCEGTTLYVAFQDAANSNKLTVMKYDGSWQTVGSNGISDGVVGVISLAVQGGVIYAGYCDQSASNKLTVKKYDGTWTTLTDLGTGQISNLSLAMNGSILYAAFDDSNNSNKASVAQFSGTSWSYVGPSTGFTETYASDVKLCFYDGVPYVVYISDTIGQGPSVMYYTDSLWSHVGSNPLCSYMASNCDLTIANGTLYVTYSEEDNSWRVSVQKY